MPEASTKNRDPPPVRPVRLGRLRTPTNCRCASVRVGNAVLRGDLEPRVANSGLYAIQCAQKAIENEQRAKALELEEQRIKLEQQRVDIEATRSNATNKPTNSTPESVLAAWHASRPPTPAPALPAPREPTPPAARKAISLPPVPAPVAAAIAAQAPRDEASGSVRAPRPAHEEAPVDLVETTPGVWAPQPAPPAQQWGVILGPPPPPPPGAKAATDEEIAGALAVIR